jgi:hypothetical protein
MIDGNGGVTGDGMGINRRREFDCETGKCGGARCGRNGGWGTEMLQFSKDSQER